jgi:hypothetical protein
VSNSNSDSWAGVLASQHAAKIEARVRAWRVVLGVFAAIWLLPTLAALVGWNPLVIPLALIAAANACAAFVGFDRYGNLIVGLAVISTAFDLLLLGSLLLILVFGLALSGMDLSGLAGIH